MQTASMELFGVVYHSVRVCPMRAMEGTKVRDEALYPRSRSSNLQGSKCLASPASLMMLSPVKFLKWVWTFLIASLWWGLIVFLTSRPSCRIFPRQVLPVNRGVFPNQQINTWYRRGLNRQSVLCVLPPLVSCRNPIVGFENLTFWPPSIVNSRLEVAKKEVLTCFLSIMCIVLIALALILPLLIFFSLGQLSRFQCQVPRIGLCTEPAHTRAFQNVFS
jgi:hypothetical protein